MNQNNENRNQDIVTNNLGNVPEKHNIKYILDKFNNGEWQNRKFNAEYTWSNTRATYYIESILLQYEMQPLILFRDNNMNVICDGYNRVITLQRFFNNELVLSEEGLHELKAFTGNRFQDFDENYRDYLLTEVTLSIKQFSIYRLVNELDLEDDEYIEKQLYIRYNSGIELKPFQKQKANFHNEKVTYRMVTLLQNDKELEEKLIKTKMLDPGKRKNMIDDGMLHIRQVIASIYCPLGTYLSIKDKEKRMEYGYLPYVERESAKAVVDLFIKVTDKIIELISLPNFSNYPNLNTSKFMNATYWLFATLQKDHLFDLEELNLKDYIEYCGSNDTIPSYFKKINGMTKSIRATYHFVIQFMKKMYAIDMNSYLDNKKERKWTSKVIDNILSFEQLKEIQYHVETGDTNVEQLMTDMERKMYILRGPYPRNEEVNIKQASRIIESIFMDIPFPDIIIYQEEKDGKIINQVLDGQQRILSLIGFLGKEYLNEKGEFEKAEKHQFRLKKLKIFTDCEGKSFDSGKNILDDELKKKILDFHIPLQIIKKDKNKAYSPEQNFSRINEGINNLKEHCYRLWNVDCDKIVMQKISEMTLNHIGNEKIFPKIKDPNKKFHEIMTECIYHTYQDKINKERQRKWRTVGKKEITMWLENIKDENRRKYIQAIEQTSQTMSIIESWLDFINIPLHELIRTQRNNIGKKKTTQLYYLLSGISKNNLIHNAYQIETIIKDFYIQEALMKKNKVYDDQKLLFETKAHLKMICYNIDQDKILTAS